MVISQQNRQNKPEFEWIITWQFLWIEDSMNNNIANYHGSMTGGKADTGCFMSFFYYSERSTGGSWDGILATLKMTEIK